MADYVVTASNGRRYRVSGPDGVPEQVVKMDVERQLSRQALLDRPAPPPPEPERTVGGQTGEFFRGIPRGAVGLIETAGTGIASLLPDEQEQDVRRAIGRVADAATSPFQRKPGYEDSWVGTLGEGVGSTLPFFGTAALPGVAARIGAGLGLGASAGAGEARTRAEEKGATAEERARATALGVLPGAAEMFPPTSLLSRTNRLRKALGNEGTQTVLRRLGRVAGSATEEGVQEAASEIAQNLIARGVYDPEQGVFTNTGESFGLGAGVGGLIAGLMELAIPGRPRGAGGTEGSATGAADTDAVDTDAVDTNTFTAPVFDEAGEQTGEAQFELRGNVVEETTLGDDGEMVTLPVYEGPRAREFFDRVKETADDAVIAEDVERLFYEFNQMEPVDVGSDVTAGVAPQDDGQIAGGTRVQRSSKAPLPDITTPEEQQMLAEPITLEEVEATGIRYPAKKWLNDNVVGKSRRDLRKLVEKNPALLTTPGTRAQLLQELIAPKTPPSMRDVVTPALTEQTSGISPDEVPGAVRVEADEQVAPPELSPSETAVPEAVPAAAVEPEAEPVPAVEPAATTAPGSQAMSAMQPKQESAATSELNRSFARDLTQSATTQELLGRVANNKLVPQPLRNLARQLRSAAPNVNVPVEMVEMQGDDVVGEYVPPERGQERILLDPRANSVPQTFMHEFVHPITYDAIRRKTPAGRRVIALYEQFKKKYPDTRNPETGDMEPAFYGLTDPFEFVAEGLSNAQFQSVLKRQNLWERFVDAIRSALGLPSSQNKIIDELLDLTKEMAVGADAKFIARRNEVVEAASMSDSPSGAKQFLSKQGGELNALSNPTGSQKLTRAVSNLMGVGGDAGRATLAWGLPLPALNDYVQSFIRKKGSSYVPFADSMQRFTDIALKSEGALRKFIDSMTAQLALMGQWRNSNPDKYDAFTDLYFGGTEARVDVTKPRSRYENMGGPNTAARLREYDRLKKVYNGLGKEGQDIYRQMRAIHNRQFSQIKKMVYDRVYSETQNRETATRISNAFTQQLRENGPLEGYAPLVRPTGKYLLQYPVEGKEQLGFEIFENQYDRKRRIKQLEMEGVDPGSIKSFLSGDVSNFDGVVPGSFLGELVTTLKEGNASAELIESVMSLGVAMSPSSMVLKRLSQRRDVPGYTRDPFLAFQQSSVSLGKRLVNLEYGAQLSSEVRDMKATRKNVGDDEEILSIVKEITRRAAYAANPTQSWWSNWLTTGTYGFTLGFNVSSSVVDFSSIALVTGPFLAKYKDAKYNYNYGYGKTYREMVKSAKEIMGMGTSADVETLATAGLEGQELADTLALLERDSRVTINQRTLPSMLNIDFSDPKQMQKYGHLQALVAKMEEVGHSERFSNLEEMAEYGEGGALSKWSARMGFMMNASERLKREIGLKSAYELELQRVAPQGNPTAAQMQAAAEKAMHMSTLLNGGSTAITGAGFQQHDVGRIAFMYRRFAALQMYLQAKTIYNATLNDDPVTKAAARQYAAYTMMTSAAFVGVKGMPMMGAFATLWAMFAAVFGDDDEDNSFESVLRRNTNPLIVEGVPNVLFNANVGQRMELTNLLYRDSNLPSDATLADVVAAHFGGPAAGTLSRFWRGKQLIEDGQIQRGIENFMPASISNILKSGRFVTEGAIETIRGDEVVPITMGGALAQALGFAPADYARAMTFKTSESRVDRRMAERRSSLMEAVYTAYRVGDADTMAKAMQKLIEFNAKYPQFAVTSRGLRQSIATRDRNTREMIMGTLPSQRRRDDWVEGAREWGLTE